MNDLEELRFGMIEGNNLVMQSEEIAKAWETLERAAEFRRLLRSFLWAIRYTTCVKHIRFLSIGARQERQRRLTLDVARIWSKWQWRGYRF